MIDDGKLLQHCQKIKIFEASTLAKMHGHEGTIILYQATDKAIEVLKESGFGHYFHAIRRIEIARDLIFNNSLSTGRYLRALQNTYYVRWGKDVFSIGKTQYIGKEWGKKRGMYVSCYDPGVKKFGMNHNVHTEFRLIGKTVIMDKLKVATINDLQSADVTFKMLADKYLMRAVINKDRFKIYFPDNDVDNFPELIDIVKREKDKIKTRLQHRLMFGFLCGGRLCQRLGVDRIYKQTPREKLLTKQGVTYFLKEFKG